LLAFHRLALFYCQFLNQMLLCYGDQQLLLKDIKAVIFDLDGTLVESEAVWTEAKQYIAKREKVNVSERVMLAYVGRSVTDFVKEVIAPANVPLIQKAIIERALVRYDNNVLEIPGASDLIRKFSSNGFAVAICSSAPIKAIQKCIKLLDIETCINTVVSTESLSRGKPDKLPYVETLRLLNIPSNHAIAFEDAAAGLTSSIAAGIKTVCVGPSIELYRFPCEMFVKNISHINLVETHDRSSKIDTETFCL
jgi:HAD superfamily hydrolase (TIGR01509 family)